MADSIVEGWLRSLNLVHYTQAFLDNGYDDLEVCKQVGEADLDAIGVTKHDHREKLLRAVRILKEEGGTAVYFTLEDPISPENSYEETVVFADLGPAPESPPQGLSAEAYDAGKTALLTYPKVQLKHILRDKLVEDEIDLSNPPFTTTENTLCQSSLTALAVKYAKEIKTHFADVWDRLEDLWKVAQDIDNFPSVCRSPMHSIYGGSSLYGFSPRGVPPPLPTCPPPSTSHVDRMPELPISPYAYSQENYVAIDGGVCCLFSRKITRPDVRDTVLSEGKKSSSLGKFLRNIGIRRSGRKNSYKQHSGDLLASDITMSDEDRIALMVMVKEGKISTETALEVVKRFEDDRRADEVKENRLFESPASRKSGKDKKKKAGVGGKPTKSHSAVYTDEAPKCHVCKHLMLNQDYELPLPPPPSDGQPLYECCRHRRVHSVGHIDFPQHLHSPPFVRAFSCSPTRNATQSSVVSSPGPAHSRLYSPILSQAPRIPTVTSQSALPQGAENLKERLSGKPQIFLHKTPSRTSLLSSESDHSMECTSHAPLKSDVVTTRNDDMNYCSTNSTVSMSSDNSPAQGRKKSENAVKAKGHRWHRSASYSTGDDGISSENDDHDDAHLLGAVSRDVCRNGGKLSGRLRDMKNKVLKGREGHTAELDFRTAQMVHRPPLRRENSYGGTRSPIYNCHNPVVSHPQAASTPDRPVYATAPILGRARVHTDFDPQWREDFLPLKRGDVVNIISMGHSGIWRGVLNGRVGNFKFAHVDVLGDDWLRTQRKEKQLRRHNSRKSKPKSVEELMQRIGLEHLTSLFMLNGFEMLETFSELDEDDLNTLNITDPEQKAKLLTAAELLNDCDSHDASDGHTRSDRSGSGTNSSDTPSSLSPATVTGAEHAQARTGNSSRDSGCYASNEQLMLKDAQKPHSSQQAKVVMTTASQIRPANTGAARSDADCSGHMCGMCGKPRVQGQSPLREDEGMETDRSDKDYTEEDKEVFAITNGYLQQRTGSPPDKSSKNSKKMSGYCKHCVHSKMPSKPKMSHSPSRGTPSANNSLSSDTSTSTTLTTIHSPSNPNLQCSVYGSSTQARRKVKPVPPPRAPGTEITSVPTPEYAARDMYPQVRNQRPKDINPVSLYGRHQISMPQLQMPLSMYYPERIASPHGSIIYGQGKQMVPEPIYGQVTIKNVSRSLIPLVSTKLSAEKIDLSEEPYSSELGMCAIPPLLIQRYAEELRQDIHSVSLVLEQVRLYHLQNHQRNSIPNDKLSESCSNAVDLKISSIEDFFISIGLPMYIDPLYEKGCCTIQLLLNLTENDLNRITGADTRHLKRMQHAIEWVRHKLQSPVKSPKSPTKSPTSTKQTSVRDRV
ncbi:SAM and SH3 domain-containing protein 1-like [Haliotis cracherodii]|uniref:SAM and SH3 domain-containing protein 1-like n=1 Tax=Haliotis cracherodii TaxID=6455 RepID=UPI0039ED80C1